MGIFANKRSICNDFGSQEGAFFNPSVEISLYSAGLWHWSQFLIDPFPPHMWRDLWAIIVKATVL